VNRKLLVVGLVVSVVINLVAIFTFGSFWREESRRRHGPPPAPASGNPQQALGELKERFQLTDAQMDTMRILFEFRRTTQRPVRDRLEAQQAEMLKLLQEPELNRARVDSLLQGVIAAQESLETGALGVLLRLRNVLTPEQRNRLPQLFRDLQQAGQQPQNGSRPGLDKEPGKGPRPGPDGEPRPGQMPSKGPGPGQPPPASPGHK
jgi:Spy/CpxP family protein refolding chaperone